ncbi:MAG: ATP-dependent sacrificial sulfur transferase LarE, partial [Calditrichia bacterium]
VARSELDEAARIAKEIGARHLIIHTNELEDENYARNPANRCYFCKNELYSKLTQIARREGIKFIANGTNMDDLGDYRPGLQAAREFEVVSPLKEAGLTKPDIRELAKKLGLRIWDKPASPCLSSRIPYGQSVTFEKLSVIEKAEAYLKSLSIREVRVRHFGTVARIETPLPDFEIIQKNMERIKKQIYSLGFEKMEWKEFKSGALNPSVNNYPKT